MTTNKGELYEYYDNFEDPSALSKAKFKCWSAIYNQKEEHVLALIDEGNEN